MLAWRMISIYFYSSKNDKELFFLKWRHFALVRNKNKKWNDESCSCRVLIRNEVVHNGTTDGIL